MKKYLPILLFGMLSGSHASSQELPRRVYLGIRMENLTDNTRHIMEIGDTKGVLISEVLPQSTAEEAGFKRGDLLLSLNGTEVGTTAEVMGALSSYKGGDKFEYALLRNKKKVNGKATFKTFPIEKFADLDVIYSDVKSVNGQQRMIITKPKNKSH